MSAGNTVLVLNFKGDYKVSHVSFNLFELYWSNKIGGYSDNISNWKLIYENFKNVISESYAQAMITAGFVFMNRKDGVENGIQIVRVDKSWKEIYEMFNEDGLNVDERK